MNPLFRRTARRIAACLMLVLASIESRADFKDPLLTPALRTERLAQAPMTAVARAGSSRLVAAGWRGVVAVSDDEGQSWRQATVPVREDLTGLAFPTATHGWAVGNEGVLLETTDAGLTWTKRLDGRVAAKLMVDKYAKLAEQAPTDKAIAAALKESENYLAQAPARPFLDVAFESESVGYIVGNYNLLFRTTDGGKTWEPWFDRTDNPDGYNLYAIRVVGDQVYIVGELGLVLRLARSEQKFVKLTTPYAGSFFAAAAVPGGVVVAGLRGNALRSADAGATWRTLSFGAASPATVSGAATLVEGGLALVTLAGQIFVAPDDKSDFKAIVPKAPMRYSGVVAAGPNKLVLVGLQGIRTEVYK